MTKEESEWEERERERGREKMGKERLGGADFLNFKQLKIVENGIWGKEEGIGGRSCMSVCSKVKR